MVKIKHDQLIIIIVITLVIGGGLGYIMKENVSSKQLGGLVINGAGSKSEDNIIKKEEFNDTDKSIKEKPIVVHITGEVQNNGVYELVEGDRVIDAVQAAGGHTRMADLDNINLAASIYDGDRIYIPILGTKEEGEESIYYTKLNSKESNNKIDINRAEKEELQKLSGIGPSKAESIISYREEVGRFTEIEELLNVSGIGNKTLEKIKDKLVLR